jgi:hypothetical protein
MPKMSKIQIGKDPVLTFGILAQIQLILVRRLLGGLVISS